LLRKHQSLRAVISGVQLLVTLDVKAPTTLTVLISCRIQNNVVHILVSLKQVHPHLGGSVTLILGRDSEQGSASEGVGVSHNSPLVAIGRVAMKEAISGVVVSLVAIIVSVSGKIPFVDVDALSHFGVAANQLDVESGTVTSGHQLKVGVLDARILMDDGFVRVIISLVLIEPIVASSGTTNLLGLMRIISQSDLAGMTVVSGHQLESSVALIRVLDGESVGAAISLVAIQLIEQIKRPAGLTVLFIGTVKNNVVHVLVSLQVMEEMLLMTLLMLKVESVRVVVVILEVITVVMMLHFCV